MSLFASQVYDEVERVSVEVVHHPRHGGQQAFETLQLGALTLTLNRAQLVQLTDILCDHLSATDPEVATTGEAGMAAAPDPVVHHDSDEEYMAGFEVWREHQDLYS